ASGWFAARAVTKQAEDRGYGEAARLQEAHLARLFALVDRRSTEAALPQRMQRGFVIDLRFRQRGLDIVARDALGLQFFDDALATESAALVRHSCTNVAGIRQIILRGQLIEQEADFVGVRSFGNQLSLQLGARVLAAREQADRLGPKRNRRQAPPAT